MRAVPQRRRTRTLMMPFGAGRRATRAEVRAAGAIRHPSRAALPVTVCPPFRCAGRDLEAFSCTAERPLILDHTLGQAQAASLGQGCVAVDHAGLSDSEDDDGRGHRSCPVPPAVVLVPPNGEVRKCPLFSAFPSRPC